MKRLLVLAAAIGALVSTSPALAGNALPNGSFEGSLSGWYAWDGVLSAASDGTVGSGAALVTANAGVTSFSINATPRPIASTVSGRTYSASAWFRSARPGLTLCLRVREYSSAGVVAAAQKCLTSTGAWQQVAALAYTPRAAGDKLDLYAYEWSAVSGDSFEIDGVVLDDGTSPAPPPADTTPPDTSITSAPSGSTTSTSASFSFAASEAGSSFRCALDGAAPTTCSSPSDYNSLAAGSHQFSVQAVDAAGNADPTPATAGWTIAQPASTDASLIMVGDQHACDSMTTTKQVADLVSTFDPSTPIATLGDASGDTGSASEYASCFDPLWGKFKNRITPAIGNHDWRTANASGYFGYFGAAAGQPGQGWYSYDLGSWHVVVLSSYCGPAGGCGMGSPQTQWLKADLAAHPAACTLAYWHHPYFTSFSEPDYSGNAAGFWNVLYNAGADVIVNAHVHAYERFAPQDPGGAADSARGIRELVVGTGGAPHHTNYVAAPNEESWNDDTYGVLQLTLHASSYDWQFVPVAGASFTDSGHGACH